MDNSGGHRLLLFYLCKASQSHELPVPLSGCIMNTQSSRIYMVTLSCVVTCWAYYRPIRLHACRQL
jgi:hypothetical protein